MQVDIENMRRENYSDRHGWKVDFSIENASKNTIIYQNVYVNIKTSDGDKKKYSFTEAWEYTNKRKVMDSFLVPIEWRKNVGGQMKVSAIAWALEGPLDPSLKKSKDGADYWGNLYGSFDLKRPNSKTTKRKVVITWDNKGKTARSNFTKGKDLTLEKSTVIY